MAGTLKVSSQTALYLLAQFLDSLQVYLIFFFKYFLLSRPRRKVWSDVGLETEGARTRDRQASAELAVFRDCDRPLM